MIHKLLLITTLLFVCSCSKEEEKPIQQSDATPEAKPQVTKHIVDPEAEGIPIKDLLLIDKEVPIIGLIIPIKWDQQKLNMLTELEMLNEVNFYGNDLSEKNIDFITKSRTVKSLTFSDCHFSDELFGILRMSVVEKITFNNSPLSKKMIDALKKAPRLKEVVFNGDDSDLKAASPNFKITQL